MTVIGSSSDLGSSSGSPSSSAASIPTPQIDFSNISWLPGNLQAGSPLAAPTPSFTPSLGSNVPSYMNRPSYTPPSTPQFSMPSVPIIPAYTSPDQIPITSMFAQLGPLDLDVDNIYLHGGPTAYNSKYATGPIRPFIDTSAGSGATVGSSGGLFGPEYMRLINDMASPGKSELMPKPVMPERNLAGVADDATLNVGGFFYDLFGGVTHAEQMERYELEKSFYDLQQKQQTIDNGITSAKASIISSTPTGMSDADRKMASDPYYQMGLALSAQIDTRLAQLNEELKTQYKEHRESSIGDFLKNETIAAALIVGAGSLWINKQANDLQRELAEMQMSATKELSQAERDSNDRNFAAQMQMYNTQYDRQASAEWWLYNQKYGAQEAAAATSGGDSSGGTSTSSNAPKTNWAEALN